VIGDAPLVVTREWIDRHGIDLVAHGDDFDATAMATFYPVPLEMGILRAVPYTPGISTSDIMARIERRLSEDPANGGG
jgi:choline-phosphate cytidylyltransferase